MSTTWAGVLMVAAVGLVLVLLLWWERRSR